MLTAEYTTRRSCDRLSTAYLSGVLNVPHGLRRVLAGAAAESAPQHRGDRAPGLSGHGRAAEPLRRVAVAGTNRDRRHAGVGVRPADGSLYELMKSSKLLGYHIGHYGR